LFHCNILFLRYPFFSLNLSNADIKNYIIHSLIRKKFEDDLLIEYDDVVLFDNKYICATFCGDNIVKINEIIPRDLSYQYYF
jgi:hypothetical protein